MRSSIRRFSKFALLLGLGIVQLIACSSDSRTGSTEEVGTGTVSLPLQATANSGNVYRLRGAFFQITHLVSGETVAVLSSDDDPSRAVLTAVLDTGEYMVTLQPGWFMERLVSGGGNNTGGRGGFGGTPNGGFSTIGGVGGVGGEIGSAGAFDSGGAFDDIPQSTGGTSAGGRVATGGSPSRGGQVGTGGAGNGPQGFFVEAHLLSDAVQFVSISARSDSFVNYSFQIGGDVIDFNQGRVNITIDVTEVDPQCDTPPDVTRSERVLLENDAAALGSIRLIDVFNSLATNGGFAGDGLRVYQEIFDSYASAALAQLPDAIHCGDEVTDGVPTLNGYPIRCDRRERLHVGDIQNFFATAIINRLDLAPENGANCGQQRMIFANPTQGRTFMIVEAQVPNPRPELGIKGCLPLAQFWLDQNSIDDPFTRGERLAEAFMVGHPDLLAQGFGPFYTATNLTVGSGQIRTNQFDDRPWTLREFKLALDGSNLKAIPFPVAESPNGALWNDESGLPQSETCRTSFVSAMQGLLTNDLAKMSFVVDHACKDSESRNDFSQDYASQLSSGFAETLASNLVGTGLQPEDIANRARFAGSCMGCHTESSSARLGGGLVAPRSIDFPHVQEFAGSDCGTRNPGATCFSTSIALNTVFLPSRLDTFTGLLGVPIVTDPCTGGTGGGGAGGSAGFGGKFSGIPPVTEPAPVITIELPQASTPLPELMRADAEIRAQYGERTISGRSAQSTH